MAWWLAVLKYYFSGRGSYPKGVYKSLFFNPDIKNFLLKINGGDKQPNFVIFLVWSTLTVGGWMVATWMRDSCLMAGWNRIFCVLGFIFLFLMLIKGMRRRCEFRIFLRDPRDGKILLTSSVSCWKIENVLWENEMGVHLDRECVELIVIAGWS